MCPDAMLPNRSRGFPDRGSASGKEMVETRLWNVKAIMGDFNQ
jgi:hypothetical protein